MTITTPHAWIGIGFLLIIFVLCEAADVWFSKRGIPKRINHDKSKS